MVEEGEWDAVQADGAADGVVVVVMMMTITIRLRRTRLEHQSGPGLNSNNRLINNGVRAFGLARLLVLQRAILQAIETRLARLIPKLGVRAGRTEAVVVDGQAALNLQALDTKVQGLEVPHEDDR